MNYVVTGGAGFIGSNIVAELQWRGMGPVTVVDDLGSGGKWMNLSRRQDLAGVYPSKDLIDYLEELPPRNTTLIHMGARTSTRDNDADALAHNNAMVTDALFEMAAEKGWTFVYASSAQVYGASRNQDDTDDAKLCPVTPYGWSKALADRMILARAKTGKVPPKWAGLRFFNVYGPGEDHKGDDRSFVSKCLDAIRAKEAIKLFRGSDDFRRDWVAVADCARLVAAIVSRETPIGGIFNVGTGEPESFVEVARVCIKSSGVAAPVETVQFPIDLRGRYQSYTCADTTKLKQALPEFQFMALKDGIERYWQSFAMNDGIERFP
jgi:ADP-L-glycero-D-manno-heptose 6-epimerase